MISQSVAYRILQVCEWFLVVVSVVLPALLKADLSSLPVWMKPLQSWLVYIRGITWIALLIAAVLLLIVRYIKGKVSDRWILGGIRDILNDLRKKAFAKNSDPLHHHRVTLFRYSRWRWCLTRWPWSGWLIPVVRSSHTTQRVKSVFRVPDDADEAEGIAGMTWTKQNVVVVSDLPDLYSPTVQDEDFAVYARETKISTKMARSRKPHARSFMGWPVNAGGQNWGVIVIDSRNPEFTSSSVVQNRYAIVSKLLQRYLERLS